MKTTKTLTQGQLKKVRRRERLAAMTPGERKANDKYRAESKAQAKAQKTSPVANAPSLAPQDVQESNPGVIPGDIPNHYQGKPAVHLTRGRRQTSRPTRRIAVQPLQGSSAQDEKKYLSLPYTTQSRAGAMEF